ncbi:hypothetical protein K440DRAFT_661113 [Wilcoxina mikolae CBS 423.85]|nr:hypothetical protein K440DRAFT_661113 [Wilcoxina mikolae CBS 423.85]
MAEVVVGTVAAVISALLAFDGVVARIRESRREKRRVAQLLPADLAAEEDFARSLTNGIQKIKRKWRQGIETFGDLFRRGDDISNAELLRMALELNTKLIGVRDGKDVLSEADYARLRAISDYGRVGTLSILTRLFQRKSRATQTSQTDQILPPAQSRQPSIPLSESRPARPTSSRAARTRPPASSPAARARPPTSGQRPEAATAPAAQTVPPIGTSGNATVPTATEERGRYLHLHDLLAKADQLRPEDLTSVEAWLKKANFHSYRARSNKFLGKLDEAYEDYQLVSKIILEIIPRCSGSVSLKSPEWQYHAEYANLVRDHDAHLEEFCKIAEEIVRDNEASGIAWEAREIVRVNSVPSNGIMRVYGWKSIFGLVCQAAFFVTGGYATSYPSRLTDYIWFLPRDSIST